MSQVLSPELISYRPFVYFQGKKNSMILFLV